MNKLVKALLLSLSMLAFAPAALAADLGNADDASNMVKKGVAFLKANGKDKTLAAASDNKGQFVDRDIYLSIYDMKGIVVAHGANAKLIGKDVSELKDADDKLFIKEILAKAGSAGKGWVDYKWPNPVTKEIQAKSVYLEKSGDLVIASGFYKK
jgi:signal transduction histidine kinase